mmetsp:Transcript_18381/g.48512  ORF Transcript_18381/g.48512 Transcript_18381/m.48512 type:complete len:238 (+) Transcript_18381:1605-2318(+)
MVAVHPPAPGHPAGCRPGRSARPPPPREARAPVSAKDAQREARARRRAGVSAARLAGGRGGARGAAVAAASRRADVADVAGAARRGGRWARLVHAAAGALQPGTLRAGAGAAASLADRCVRWQSWLQQLRPGAFRAVPDGLQFPSRAAACPALLAGTVGCPAGSSICRTAYVAVRAIARVLGLAGPAELWLWVRGFRLRAMPLRGSFPCAAGWFSACLRDAVSSVICALAAAFWTKV